MYRFKLFPDVREQAWLSTGNNLRNFVILSMIICNINAMYYIGVCEQACCGFSFHRVRNNRRTVVIATRTKTMIWRRAHIWRELAIGVAAILVAWLLFLTVSIIRYAGESDSGQADAAVVLGAAVVDGLPTPVFEERIRHAIDLYQTKRVRVLILTGGVGEGDILAESEVARAYCLAHGVEAEDLAIEKQSHTTYENLIQARTLLTDRGLRRVLIVSDPLHMRRAITEARDIGIDAYPSPTPTTKYVGTGAKAKFAARELYYYSRYLIQRTLGMKAN